MSRDERRILREVKGSQTKEKGSSFFDSDQDLTSGKAPRETLSSIDLGVEGEEVGSSVGGKIQSYIPTFDGFSGGYIDLKYKTQLGRRLNQYFILPIFQGRHQRA